MQPMHNRYDTLQLNVDACLLFAFPYRSHLKRLASIHSATRYPPPTIPRLIDCQELASLRMAADDDGVLVSLELCALAAWFW